MSLLLRAWIFSVVVTLVGLLVVGASAASDPPDWALTAVSGLAVVLDVAVVGLWYRRQQPAGPVGPYALAVLPFPALICVLSLWFNHAAEAESSSLLTGAGLSVVLLALAAVGAWFVPVSERSGY
jgi:hypothetical protein